MIESSSYPGLSSPSTRSIADRCKQALQACWDWPLLAFAVRVFGLTLLLFVIGFAGVRIGHWPEKNNLNTIEHKLDREIEQLHAYQDTLAMAISGYSNTVLLLKQNANLGLDLEPNRLELSDTVFQKSESRQRSYANTSIRPVSRAD